MKKVIFLDIDGVLVTHSHISRLMDKNVAYSDKFGHLFDPTCVRNLKDIVERTGADIVISSSFIG